MKTSTMIGLASAGAGALAAYSESVPAMFITVIGAAIFWQGHSIEVKLNKLLDRHGITVTSKEINE